MSCAPRAFCSPLLPSPRLPLAAASAGLGLLLSGPAWAGSIDVRSDRNGQEILLDGSPTGRTTPGRIDGVAPGQHSVMVRGACHSGTTTVSVPDKGVVTASLLSMPTPGTLSLSVEPGGASVSIDGTSVRASGTHSLSCGTHSVRVAKDGFLQEIRKVDVGAAETTSIQIALEQLGLGSVTVTAKPATAEIVLDGELVGTGAYQNPDVTAGPHVLEVKAEGFEAKTEMFVLEAQDSRVFDIVLPAGPGGGLASTPPTKSPRSSGGHALRNTGIGVAVAGAGVGIFGLTRFAVSGKAYQDYLDTSQDPSASAGEAQAIRDDEVVPARNLGVTLSGLGAAMLAGGLTMAIAF